MCGCIRADWFISLRSFFTDCIIICSLIFKGWVIAFYFYCSFPPSPPQKSMACSVYRSCWCLVVWKQAFSHNVAYYYYNFLNLAIATNPEQAENRKCWNLWWGIGKIHFIFLCYCSPSHGCYVCFIGTSASSFFLSHWYRLCLLLSYKLSFHLAFAVANCLLTFSPFE